MPGRPSRDRDLRKADAHLHRSQSTARRVFQYYAYLIEGNAREQVNEFVDRHTALEIFEESRYWYPRATKQPSTADAFRVSLGGRTA